MEETQYALTFRTEAIIPAKLGSGSYRVETFKVEANDEGLKLHLDLLQESVIELNHHVSLPRKGS